MKNVEYCSVCQGSANKKGLGWVKRIGVFGLSMACLLSPISLGSSKASDAIITQFAYLQWLAQVVGDTAQLPANASAADYVAWARSLNVEPAGGWHPAALMTSDSYAQTMAQLLGIAVANPDGRNLKRELEKEDIKVPDKITTHNLMNAIDESVFKKNKKPKKTHDKGDHTTGPPTKPPTTDGHGSSGHHTEKQPTTKPPKDKDKDKDK